MKEIEKVLKATANHRRLMVLKFLRDHEKREATVGGIAHAIKLSFKATSRHLFVLRSAGVLDKEQRGLEVYYSIIPKQHFIIRQLLLIL